MTLISAFISQSRRFTAINPSSRPIGDSVYTKDTALENDGGKRPQEMMCKPVCKVHCNSEE